MTNLAELKKIVDELTSMLDERDVKDFKDVQVKFKTFDERFEENADEFQEPDTITSVEVDVLKWDSVTITIERKLENERIKTVKEIRA